MGGKEGSRGYVYQGIVAVLESFSLSFWDKIYVEFPTDDDKVDIALSFGNNIVRAIQVKSTNNTFTPQQIKQWIRDLTNDYPCPNYELVLIGQCSGTARTFINSIEKYILIIVGGKPSAWAYHVSVFASGRQVILFQT